MLKRSKTDDEIVFQAAAGTSGGSVLVLNDDRDACELIATGASRIATACPFCYIMIDDGVKGAGKDDDEVKVGDISMHVLEALERASTD